MAIPSTVQSLEEGGGDNTPNSVPVCEPQGVTGGPSGRPGYDDFRTRGCPARVPRAVCPPRTAPRRLPAVPYGDGSGPSTNQGTLPGAGRAQGRGHPAILVLPGDWARPCLGHQGAPRSRSAPGLPGPPFAPAPAEPTECCAGRPRGIAPAGDPSASPGCPALSRRKTTEATKTPSPGKQPHQSPPKGRRGHPHPLLPPALTVLFHLGRHDLSA